MIFSPRLTVARKSVLPIPLCILACLCISHQSCHRPGHAFSHDVHHLSITLIITIRYTNDLYFSADVVIRGVGWSNVATNAALPLHVGYGMNHELFLYHVLACNAGDDAFSVAARREYWEHRTSMFLGGGAPAGALQIGRDLKVLMRREKAAVALWTVASTAVGFAGPTYKAYFTALTQAAEVGKYGAATFLLQKDIAEIISTLMKLVRSEQANLSGLTMEDAKQPWSELTNSIEYEDGSKMHLYFGLTGVKSVLTHAGSGMSSERFVA